MGEFSSQQATLFQFMYFSTSTGQQFNSYNRFNYNISSIIMSNKLSYNLDEKVPPPNIHQMKQFYKSLTFPLRPKPKYHHQYITIIMLNVSYLTILSIILVARNILSNHTNCITQSIRILGARSSFSHHYQIEYLIISTDQFVSTKRKSF